jgi:hypothetical protein
MSVLSDTARGVQAALRGYRLQALYTLHRLLTDDDGSTYHLEGVEDLDVYGPDGQLRERHQVKAYQLPLTLGDLDPAGPNSYLRRVLGTREDALQQVVSFGPYGPELENLRRGEARSRAALTKKLVAHGYGAADVARLLRAVRFEEVDERALQVDVLDRLRHSVVGMRPDLAFDLLHAWLFSATERRARLTRLDLVQQLNAIGEFLAEREAHHAQWGRTLITLPDEQPDAHAAARLVEEFNQGVAARYAHILAGVDVQRDQRLDEIDIAFARTRVVVVHGSSGQGKSALAYRYLKNFVPEAYRYEVRLVNGREHALSVVRALLGHVRAIQVPAFVYLDVSPRDEG